LINLGVEVTSSELVKKHVVAGLGEIGSPILAIISKKTLVVGFDINQKLMNKKKFAQNKNLETSFLHICIPYTKNFQKNIIPLNKKFQPDCIVIHSTISPYATELLQKKLKVPIIYSATRGIHKRMEKDINRYTKFFSIYSWAPNSKWAIKSFSSIMKKTGIKTKKMSSPLVLELAKIVVDTSYYGWLINYAQLSNMIAIKNKVNYDEMWSFSDEIHKNLGNRPKMYPGFIGGHCVIPNLELIKEDSLYEIDKINNMYARKVKNSKSIRKKYDKSKKASFNV